MVESTAATADDFDGNAVLSAEETVALSFSMEAEIELTFRQDLQWCGVAFPSHQAPVSG